MVSPNDPEFWKKMQSLESAGATIAMHGYQHLCESRGKSILGLHEKTEFAGIAKDVQDKIFELYFTTKKGGSGIGLAQTYQIMQWHYGSVDFESIEGQGTTFRLRIPMVEAAVEASREKEVTTSG